MTLKFDLACILTGTFLSLALYTPELVGAYLYFFISKRGRSDHRALKTTVAAAVISDTVGMVGICATTFMAMVTYFGALERVPVWWSTTLYVICNAITGLIVQTFMTYRYWRLSSCYVLSIIIMLFAIVAFVMTLYVAIASQVMSAYPRRVELLGYAIVSLAGTAIADILITLALVQKLYRIPTHTHKTKRLVKELAVRAMQTGAVTTVVALAALISHAISPTTRLSTVFAYILGRAYTLTMLFILLQRPGPGSSAFTVHSDLTDGLSSHTGAGHSTRSESTGAGASGGAVGDRFTPARPPRNRKGSNPYEYDYDRGSTPSFDIPPLTFSIPHRSKRSNNRASSFSSTSFSTSTPSYFSSSSSSLRTPRDFDSALAASHKNTGRLDGTSESTDEKKRNEKEEGPNEGVAMGQFGKEEEGDLDAGVPSPDDAAQVDNTPLDPGALRPPDYRRERHSTDEPPPHHRDGHHHRRGHRGQRADADGHEGSNAIEDEDEGSRRPHHHRRHHHHHQHHRRHHQDENPDQDPETRARRPDPRPDAPANDPTPRAQTPPLPPPVTITSNSNSRNSTVGTSQFPSQTHGPPPGLNDTTGSRLVDHGHGQNNADADGDEERQQEDTSGFIPLSPRPRPPPLPAPVYLGTNDRTVSSQDCTQPDLEVCRQTSDGRCLRFGEGGQQGDSGNGSEHQRRGHKRTRFRIRGRHGRRGEVQGQCEFCHREGDRDANGSGSGGGRVPPHDHEHHHHYDPRGDILVCVERCVFRDSPASGAEADVGSDDYDRDHNQTPELEPGPGPEAARESERERERGRPQTSTIAIPGQVPVRRLDYMRYRARPSQDQPPLVHLEPTRPLTIRRKSLGVPPASDSGSHGHGHTRTRSETHSGSAPAPAPAPAPVPVPVQGSRSRSSSVTLVDAPVVVQVSGSGSRGRRRASSVSVGGSGSGVSGHGPPPPVPPRSERRSASMRRGTSAGAGSAA